MLDEKSRPTTNIESLSNEIFYEIFDYLDGYHICKAFLNLNTRFQQFFTTFIPLKCNFIACRESDLLDYYKYIIIPHKGNIISLSFWYASSINQLSLPFIIDISFKRLESLVLNGIKLDKLLPLLADLKYLSHLFSLFIYLDDNSEDFTNLYQLIFDLPFLKYNKLLANPGRRLISLSIEDIKQFSNIEYLFINHYCTLNNLFDILLYTPKLSRLKLKYLGESNLNTQNREPIILSNLTHITIDELDLSFDLFTMFITKIVCKLQVLYIGIKSMDMTYLNPNQWEQLISQYIPYLSKFHFEYHEKVARRTFSMHHALLSQFTRSFWIKRQWLFEIHLDMALWSVGEIIYSIHPYRVPNLHRQQMANSAIRFSNDVQLVVSSIESINYDLSHTNYIKHIIPSINITSLIINCNMVSACVLTELVQILSNLDSLTISCCAQLIERCTHREELKHRHLSSANNNITRVNIGHVTKLEQMDLIIKFCPHMHYFQVDCVNYIELSSLIRFIFIEKNAYIKNLFSLCLWIWKVNDDTIKILQTMIDREQLLRDYTIEQINDKIYLQWNNL